MATFSRKHFSAWQILSKGLPCSYSTPHPRMLFAAFSLFPSVFKLPGLPRESPRQNSRVPLPGDSWDPRGSSSAGASLPLLPSCSGSLFSMRAGRELAGLRLPRHHCCGCGCLQCPRSHAAGAVTAVRGRRESARRQPLPPSFDFELTSRLSPVCQAPWRPAWVPPEILHHQPAPQRGKLFAPSFLHLFSSQTR